MGEGDGGWGKEPQPKILFLFDVNVAAGGHVDLKLTPSTDTQITSGDILRLFLQEAKNCTSEDDLRFLNFMRFNTR